MADTTLHVARKLHAYSLQNPGIVPLSPLECLVLLHVHKRPGVSPSELAHELALRSSNTAAALRGLIEKEQIERRADSLDKRVARLYLTPLAEESIIVVRSNWKELLLKADITLEELRIAVNVLSSIDTILAEP